MKKLLIAFACAGLLLAQDHVMKVVTIKNGNLGAINRTLHDLSGGAGVLVRSDNEHLVLSGPKDQVAAMEEIVKQLDVAPAPAPNIETTVYMLVASEAQAAGGMPAELGPVVTQLKSLFPYKGYRLLDSFILRSRSGLGAEASGFVPGTGFPLAYQAKFGHAFVDSGDKGRIVRINNLKLGMRVPVATGTPPTTYFDVGINTDVDVPEGKKVVVGKTSSIEGPDSALILVISAKVVD